eukprot:CAMPEP_0178495556 /NCGR_PEP_ID=MMETSP0696-20121128/13614_1 /TAXON_ID=265572 /ORGANISM="Extubocellulus spinifer, Strain CCMP396" /LENGTH=92 /DNA_ID=CAMNT_0020123715 /DNA_START=224 /DNA_END=503 /DNA_ORIENTATION=-
MGRNGGNGGTNRNTEILYRYMTERAGGGVTSSGGFGGGGMVSSTTAGDPFGRNMGDGFGGEWVSGAAIGGGKRAERWVWRNQQNSLPVHDKE